MAVGSLLNMSIGAKDLKNETLLMPKLAYRFRIDFTNFGPGASYALTKQVVDCTRPTVSFDPMVVDIYNSRINLAGKHTWEPITVTLRDDATGKVQSGIGNQLQKQFDFIEQSTAASGANYKFEMIINILDGGNGDHAPQVLEAFELYGCYIENAAYNQLSYSESTPVTVTLTIKYDNAAQYSRDTGALFGIGEAVSRGAGNLITGVGNSFTAPQ